jgi:hypothetical protein
MNLKEGKIIKNAEKNTMQSKISKQRRKLKLGSRQVYQLKLTTYFGANFKKHC